MKSPNMLKSAQMKKMQESASDETKTGLGILKNESGVSRESIGKVDIETVVEAQGAAIEILLMKSLHHQALAKLPEK